VHKYRVAAFLLCFWCLSLPDLYGQERTISASSRLVTEYTVKIVRSLPHDPQAFTEGLFFEGGFLYESTGINGRSSVRKVDLETGRVIQKTDLPSHYFGEGISLWKNSIFQLTWKSGQGFIYNLQSFSKEREFRYAGEGWGMTHDDKNLIMSNGSSKLLFLDPETLRRVRVLPVAWRGKPVELLNELEYIKGEIFANIWFKDFVARISPKTGEVTGWIDMSDLRRELPPRSGAEALNGIAYDKEKDRIFVTGKLWPSLFEVEIVRAK
jgi:glutamine cyclotransferase